MILFDVIIVGSGPAGVAAALSLQERDTLMLDVGHKPLPDAGFVGNFYDMDKKNPDYHDRIIGPKYESLHNIEHDYLMPKIKAPRQRYILQDAERFGRIWSDTFHALFCYARGGLANAWGCQLYRALPEELSAFPFSPAVLEPYYDRLTARIGICGMQDDLERFYGTAAGLLPPPCLGRLGARVQARYQRRRERFNRLGVTMGRPRLGLLTQPHGGRPAHTFDNLEFFKPGITSLYTPVITLDEMIARKTVTYRPGFKVLEWQEQENGVEVTALGIAGDRLERFRAKRVILAAGVLGTAAIVLRTRRAYGVRRPIMENLLSYIPFVDPRFIGAAHETSGFYTKSNLFYTGLETKLPVMGTFYLISGLLHADLMLDLPLALGANLRVLKYLLPSMLVLHLWYGTQPQPERNHLHMDEKGDLHIHYGERLDGRVESALIRHLRGLGLVSFPGLCRFPLPGNSYHYAGTFPMRHQPGPLETDPMGRLAGCGRVHIADASVFPNLMAKNLSFTSMANAMRIADYVNRLGLER